MNTPTRVADICAHDMFIDAVLIGVPTPTNHPVVAVDLVTATRVLEIELTEMAVAVLALDPHDGLYREHMIDLLLRRCANASSSMLIVVGAALPLAESTRQLAEALHLPVLAAPEVSTIDVVVELRSLIANPGRATAQLALELARRLPGTPRRLEDIVELLIDVLPSGNVYICSGRDLTLAGTPEFVPPEHVVELTVAGGVEHDGCGAIVVPIEGVSGETAIWLVAERRRSGPQWHGLAMAALQLASGAVLAWLASEHASAAQDARWRSTLLAEIVERGSAISPTVAEQAARAGWQLDGWHTGVHIRCEPPTLSPLAIRSIVEQMPRAALRHEALVERTDGWSTWITSTGEPGPEEIRELARSIRQGLREPPPGHAVVIGIGSPYRDVGGISSTLSGARQAALLGTSSGQPVSVRVLDDLGAARLLLGWYSSEAFADYAAELLAPLAGGDPELFTTLEVYLESACSAATAARKLGVHRNTVAKRIARTERALGTSLMNGDTRLALQLALRVMRTREA